jgi:hypothetical protein
MSNLNKRIIYTRPDGGVSIVVPAIEDMDLVLSQSVPKDVTNVQIVEYEDLPTDRTFRNAWVQEDKSISVDMDKARDIHMDKIRWLRNQELQKLDPQFMKALEQNDTDRLKEIATLKQELRDIPQTFDLTVATTPDELKELIPQQLKGE